MGVAGQRKATGTVRVANLLPDPRVGGPQRRVALLAKEIRPLGYETVVVIPPGPAVEFFRDQGIECVVFDFPRPRRSHLVTSGLRFGGGLGLDVWRLASLLRALHADILHCNGMLTVIGPPAGRLAGTATVWHLNDTQTPRAVCRALRGALGPMVDRMAVASEAVARHSLEIGASYDVLYPPVDLDRCPTADASLREPVLLGLGLDPAVPTVLTIGHINAVKGHSDLLDAVALLRAEGRSLQLVLVGDRIDAEIADAVEERIVAHGLGGVVRLAGGTENIGQYLSAADFFVLPSLSEGMPIALLEAMAAGLPVVSTAVGGVAEAIEDGVEGLLAAPGDARALARQMGRMLDDREIALEMGRYGSKAVRERFSTAASGKALAEVYGRLVEGRGGGKARPPSAEQY